MYFIAFGDIMYKVPVEYQTVVLPNIPADIYRRFARYHHRIIANYKTPPYLSSNPIVNHYEIQKTDRFIIIASDGLWWFTGKEDEHSPDGDQTVADIMSKWKDDETDEETNPATHLLKYSFIQRRLYDLPTENASAEFDQVVEVSKLLTKQPPRSFRDDVTIVIIQLGSEGMKDASRYGEVIEAQEVDVSCPKLCQPDSKSRWPWSRG
jgi:serine/threonine protein phosphatase PrpC